VAQKQLAKFLNDAIFQKVRWFVILHYDNASKSTLFSLKIDFHQRSSTMPSIMDLKKFFDTPDKPINMAEFNEFWKSLSEEEKIDYKRQYDMIMSK